TYYIFNLSISDYSLYTIMKKFSKKRSISLFIEICVSIVILIYLFTKIGINNIYSQLLNNSVSIILFILFILFLIFIIETAKYLILLRAIDKRPKFFRIFRHVLITFLFSIIIPGKMGQFAMAYFLKKEKISMGDGVAIVLIDKIISLVVLSLFGILGFYTFFSIRNAFISFISIVFIITAIIISLRSEMIKNFIKKRY
ncbi:MAG: flippase-like domain-containing protein, partial [Spirochaetes bacterium]|nr:flippase-like domain-containing protein [Spirochaetota bacterium]